MREAIFNRVGRMAKIRTCCLNQKHTQKIEVGKGGAHIAIRRWRLQVEKTQNARPHTLENWMCSRSKTSEEAGGTR